MQKSTRKHLIDLYNRLPYRNNDTCIKFNYEFNGVVVNLYFDAFDPNSVSFAMILSYEKKYYYTLLNILETNTLSEYLPEIKKSILMRILVDNKLERFFGVMEHHLLNSKFVTIHYFKDTCYKNTFKCNNAQEDLPFWWHLKKVRMANETLLKLLARTDIPLWTLQEIQKRGYTLVRTSDPNLRTELTLILKNIGITIK